MSALYFLMGIKFKHYLCLFCTFMYQTCGWFLLLTLLFITDLILWILKMWSHHIKHFCCHLFHLIIWAHAMTISFVILFHLSPLILAQPLKVIEFTTSWIPPAICWVPLASKCVPTVLIISTFLFFLPFLYLMYCSFTPFFTVLKSSLSFVTWLLLSGSFVSPLLSWPKQILACWWLHCLLDCCQLSYYLSHHIIIQAIYNLLF